jgi:hypothetical protein
VSAPRLTKGQRAELCRVLSALDAARAFLARPDIALGRVAPAAQATTALHYTRPACPALGLEASCFYAVAKDIGHDLAQLETAAHNLRRFLGLTV